MLRVKKLDTFQVFDSHGLWFTFYSNDTPGSIFRAFQDLRGADGCIQKNGVDLACFSTVDGENIIIPA